VLPEYDTHSPVLPYTLCSVFEFHLNSCCLETVTVDFVEICNVYIGKMIIKAAKRIFNFDKMCRIVIVI